MGKLIDFSELATIKSQNPGKSVVHCHGVFDLFHHGHFLHLQSAKKYGQILVVTVTPDKFVNKGPGRPRFPAEQRSQLLAALEIVDYVAINKFPKAVEPIQALRPDFYVKGPDYKNQQSDLTGGILEEDNAVKSVGGQLVFTDDQTNSSTELLNQYFSHWNEEQSQAIETVKSKNGLSSILTSIESFKNLSVLVVGEPIVDTYVFCQAEGISSKSPTVSAKFLSQEDYAGGSLAIANHLAALDCKVNLLITHGGENYFRDLLKKTIDAKIKLHEFIIDKVPTPRKTRYMAPFRSQRMFELIDLRADQWSLESPQKFISQFLELANSVDLVILADFGHGLFEGEVLESLGKIKTFKALNAQTNSGNFGFNPFTKHKHYEYLSIDERETRVATHDRFTPALDLSIRTFENLIRRPTSITLGTQGSVFFNKEGKQSQCPSFFKEVVDTTGAGDAYFAITSLLAKMEAEPRLVPFVGNCFAGLKTQIMGNKSAVSKVDLIRTLQSILR